MNVIINKKLIKKIKFIFFKLNISYVDLFIFIFICGFSWWLMSHTFGYEDGQFVISSKVWSDFAAHIPLIRSFSLGRNFPPEYPMFPGEPIRYHYLFYFLVGMFEKVGLNIAFSLNILSVLGFSLLLWMIYKISILFFKSRKAGVISIFLFLFNGSMSFLEFFKEYPLSMNSWRDIVSAKNYVSFGPWDGGNIAAFWNLNIYTNQRHLGLSFGLLLLIIYPLLKTTLDKKYFFNKKFIPFLWLAFFIFPVLHQAGFVALIVFVMGWIGTYFFDLIILKRKLFLKNKNMNEIVGFYLMGVVLAVISFLRVYGFNEKMIVWQVGFLSSYKSYWGLAEYWFFNMGLYVFLFPLLILWFLSKTIKKNFPLILFLAIFSLFFIVANLFRLSSDMINNHKFINLFMIGMNIFFSGFLIDRWNKRKYLRILIIPVFFFLTFSGIIDFFPLINDHKYRLPDFPSSEIQTWIVKNTNANSTFLTTSYLYHPASLAGRKIFLDYGYFAWSLGYNDRERRMVLPTLFSSTISIESWCNMMYEKGIDYVAVSPGKGDLGDSIFLNESFVVRQLQPTFVSDDDYKIYKVSGYCYE